ncbi:MAG: hypothetical protein R3E98_19320 [Gemmatimonadota bacterium]
MRLRVVFAAFWAAACVGEPRGEPGAADASDTTAVSTPEAGDVPQTAGPQASALISDSAVGCLELEATLAEVRSACGATTDTTLHLEGQAQEAVWVDVGPGRVLAEVRNGRVWRIQVRDPGLTTRDSIGVGAPVNRLATLPGISIAYGEGTFAMTEAHCGNSFSIQGLPSRREPWGPEELRALGDSVRVVGILVFGRCDG